MPLTDPARLQLAVNADPEFRLAARYWNATLGLESTTEALRVEIADGQVVSCDSCRPGQPATITVSGPDEGWAEFLAPVPRPFYQDLLGGCVQHHGFQVAGDMLSLSAYYQAMQRLFAVMSALRAGGRASSAAAGATTASPAAAGATAGAASLTAAPADPAGGVRGPRPETAGEASLAAAPAGASPRTSPPPGSWTPRFDSAVGRYVYLTIEGVEYRVYFEEAGTGIPLLLQHTAGADARQWRHLLEDAEIQRHFRMIAYDLPYHARSLPPAGVEWWTREYRLTREFLMQVPVTLARALGLDRPVFMGCSIGGHLAADLACFHPGVFRAAIALEGALATPARRDLSYLHHPRISHEYRAGLMHGITAPRSPEACRRETAWIYSQGAPGVFRGDLHYYNVEHDLAGLAPSIDTRKTSLHVLTGEYDWSSTPAMGQALAAEVPGATFQAMPGLGHFPMCEDPARFRQHLLPVLEAIRARTS